MQTLELRLENWAELLRWRAHRDALGSFETRYRGPQRRMWDYGTTPPTAPPAKDPVDGRAVDHAWQSMGDAFHQTLLGAWYVKRWTEQHCLRVSWEAAGEPARRRKSDFEASLAMARALIAAQLELPAVTRRARITQRIRDVLGIVNLPNGLDNVAQLVAA